MTTETVLDALLQIDLTDDLTLLQMEKLASMSRMVEFAEGEIIFREGDVGHSVYLIREGAVAIETHLPGRGRITILTVGPGHLLSWSSLFPPHRKTAGGRALTDTRLIGIDASQLWEACQEDRDMGYLIMARMARVIAERLKITRLQLLDIFAPA